MLSPAPLSSSWQLHQLFARVLSLLHSLASVFIPSSFPPSQGSQKFLSKSRRTSETSEMERYCLPLSSDTPVHFIGSSPAQSHRKHTLARKIPSTGLETPTYLYQSFCANHLFSLSNAYSSYPKPGLVSGTNQILP